MCRIRNIIHNYKNCCPLLPPFFQEINNLKYFCSYRAQNFLRLEVAPHVKMTFIPGKHTDRTSIGFNIIYTYISIKDNISLLQQFLKLRFNNKKSIAILINIQFKKLQKLVTRLLNYFISKNCCRKRP